MGLLKKWMGIDSAEQSVGEVRASSEGGARGLLQSLLRSNISTTDTYEAWEAAGYKVVQVDPKTGKRIESSEDAKT